MNEWIYPIHFGADGLTAVRDITTNSVVIDLPKGADVLSTAIVNGGLRRDIATVYNHTCSSNECYMLDNTYEGHILEIMRRNGFDSDNSVCMTTAAKVENCAVSEQVYEALCVTALVTAGIENNGGRAGDPCPFYTPVDKPKNPSPGTINIILVIDASLPDGIMERALVMCTEAKTAALQELLAASRFSNGIATGSGTDQTVIISNPASKLYFEHAGKHSKLGELIGLAVKEALKRALYAETGLSAEKQFSVLRRMDRYGISKKNFHKIISANYPNVSNKQAERIIETLDRREMNIAMTSLFLHLLDQKQWGMLSEDCVNESVICLIRNLRSDSKIRPSGETVEEYLNTWQKALISAEILKTDKIV